MNSVNTVVMNFAVTFAKALNAKAILISSDVVQEPLTLEDEEVRSGLSWSGKGNGKMKPPRGISGR